MIFEPPKKTSSLTRHFDATSMTIEFSSVLDMTQIFLKCYT